MAFARGRADLGRVPTLRRDVGEEQRNGDRGTAPVAPREVRPYRAGREKPDRDFGVVAQALDRVALRKRGGQRHADGEDAQATEHEPAGPGLFAQSRKPFRRQRGNAEGGQHQRARRIAESAVARRPADGEAVEVEPGMLAEGDPDAEQGDGEQEPVPARLQRRGEHQRHR